MLSVTYIFMWNTCITYNKTFLVIKTGVAIEQISSQIEDSLALSGRQRDKVAWQVAVAC